MTTMSSSLEFHAMAKTTHHDDDQAKKPDEPKPVMPNMSLDDPAEEPLEVEEVFEDDIPIVEAAPASGVAEAAPASDVFLVDDVEEVAPVAEAPPVVMALPVEPGQAD